MCMKLRLRIRARRQSTITIQGWRGVRRKSTQALEARGGSEVLRVRAGWRNPSLDQLCHHLEQDMAVKRTSNTTTQLVSYRTLFRIGIALAHTKAWLHLHRTPDCRVIESKVGAEETRYCTEVQTLTVYSLTMLPINSTTRTSVGHLTSSMRKSVITEGC